LPQLSSFRPEDSGQLLTKTSVDRVVDNILFLIQQNPQAFWNKATGKILSGKVPLNTARGFLKSLFFMFDEYTCYNADNQISLFNNALKRIEIASEGFGPEEKFINDTSKETFSLIRGWNDDIYLSSIIRSTPLIMIILIEIIRIATFVMMNALGYRRKYVDPNSHLECWILSKTPSVLNKTNIRSKIRPLVLIPGAGLGLTSFLPLAFLMKRQFPEKTIFVFRIPWVEVCHPWAILPQWSVVITGILAGLSKT